jgi:hypothetical protein
MGYLFVTDGLADPSITAIDSTLIKAKGPLWHKSSMKKGYSTMPWHRYRRKMVVDIVIPRNGFSDINYI